MNGDTELRKLPAGHLFRLAQILESGEAWKRLMSVIPKSDEEGTTALKYKMEHIELIERASLTQRRRCSEIFLEEWSTSGRKRPDLTTLLGLLVQASLFRAAEFVAVELLQDAAPARPDAGPSALVDLSEETIDEISRLQLKHFEEVKMLNRLEPPCPPPPNNVLVEPHEEGGTMLNRLEPPCLPPNNVLVEPREEGGMPLLPEESRLPESDVRDDETRTEANTDERLVQIQETIQIDSLYIDPTRAATAAETPPPVFDTLLPHYPYSDLECFTSSFSDLPLSEPGGRKLGTGAFGSVYLAVLPLRQRVAVKRLHRDAINLEKQFRNEVEALSKFCHANLLPLLGYCCEPPNYCLVYEYMSNGSLQERLAQKESPLPWRLRINIGLGTSRGIYHLHSAFEKPLIHRDVKTANILLDQNMEPKLGDFGLVRLGSNAQRSQSVALTTTVFGTSAYMAREAFRGDISVKIDTYSFGVVILELLTGLAPYDDHRDEGHDLVTYVETVVEESVIPILDMAAGDWGNSHIVGQLFALSLDCLEDKRRRPNMSDVVQRLQVIAGTASNYV